MRVLVVRVGRLRCAVSLEHVAETMRPLPIEPMRAAVSFVRGVSVIRGAAVPVVDLAAILGCASGAASRLVTLRVSDRQVALEVDEVIGVRVLDSATLGDTPPLLSDDSAAYQAIATLDSEVLVLLCAARILPEDHWRSLEPAGSAP